MEYVYCLCYGMAIHYTLRIKTSYTLREILYNNLAFGYGCMYYLISV